MKRIALLCNMSPDRVDGIRDYSLRLAHALRQHEGLHVDLIGRHPNGLWERHPGEETAIRRVKRLNQAADGYEAAIIQYQPYMYGPWGFAPWLVLALWRLHRANPHMTIALMVHEMYVSLNGVGQAAQGIWQRLQLRALRLNVNLVFVSTETWTQSLSRWSPSRPTLHLPVASTLPEMRHVRTEERRVMGIGDDEIVLICLGANPLNYSIDFIVESANTLCRSGYRVTLLNLGAHASPLHGLDESIKTLQPGLLPAETLARKLSIGDIFLAPILEGVTSRRTSVMAALQHALAIAATEGPLTDPQLRKANRALLLVPRGRRDLFVDGVRQLAQDRHRRHQLGRAGRSLYLERYDWPGLSRRLIGFLNESRRECLARP